MINVGMTPTHWYQTLPLDTVARSRSDPVVLVSVVCSERRSAMLKRTETSSCYVDYHDECDVRFKMRFCAHAREINQTHLK